MTPEQDREVLDRLRRVETRMVKFFEHMGFNTERQLPLFDPDTGTLHITSRETSIADIIAAIPADRDRPVTVWHREHRLGMWIKEGF